MNESHKGFRECSLVYTVNKLINILFTKSKELDAIYCVSTYILNVRVFQREFS